MDKAKTITAQRITFKPRSSDVRHPINADGRKFNMIIPKTGNSET
jgi:hypothetical protein